MTDVPLVTVVTPSFNQARFIRQTIESVLTQSYPRIEYLVMDGGSTDETRAILESYGDRLAWVSAPDRGQTDAINKGWRRARGTIVAYLNSDDTYLPGAVEKAVAGLCAYPEAGALYGEGYHVDEAGRVIDRYPTEPFDMSERRCTRRSSAPSAGISDACPRSGSTDTRWPCSTPSGAPPAGPTSPSRSG